MIKLFARLFKSISNIFLHFKFYDGAKNFIDKKKTADVSYVDDLFSIEHHAHFAHNAKYQKIKPQLFIKLTGAS